MGFYVPIMWVEKGPFGAVLGLFWAIFAVFEGPKSPLASIRPGSARKCDSRAFVSAALKFLPNMT